MEPRKHLLNNIDNIHAILQVNTMGHCPDINGGLFVNFI